MKLLLLENLNIHSNCSESGIFLGKPATGLQLNPDYLLFLCGFLNFETIDSFFTVVLGADAGINDGFPLGGD